MRVRDDQWANVATELAVAVAAGAILAIIDHIEIGD